MDFDLPSDHRPLFVLAFGAALACFVSIAVSHILLGASVGYLLLYRDRARIPRVWIPVAVFFGATLLSAAMSPDPAAAWPQIRKFYVWLFLPVVYSGIRRAADARRLMLGFAICGTASALWGLVQFARKYERAMSRHEDFYQAYVGDRITGFMSHWMTFASHLMIAFLIVAALVLLAKDRRRGVATGAWVGAGAVLSAGLVLGFTRSIWPATAAGLVYVVWHWRRWFVLALPLLGAGAIVMAPEPVNRRIESAWKPSNLDSNDHREALRRTGLAMIAAHPWTGVGPEEVGPRFLEFAPEGVPRPLPKEWYTQHLHNIYVHFAAERGIPALAGLLGFLGLAVWRLARAKPPPEYRFIPLAAVASIIGILVGGYWEVNLGDSEVLGALLAVIACGFVAGEER
ncbi:MAG: O-antigen ligase family protein [Bryobacteraceae bacterium]